MAIQEVEGDKFLSPYDGGGIISSFREVLREGKTVAYDMGYYVPPQDPVIVHFPDLRDHQVAINPEKIIYVVNEQYRGDEHSIPYFVALGRGSRDVSDALCLLNNHTIIVKLSSRSESLGEHIARALEICGKETDNDVVIKFQEAIGPNRDRGIDTIRNLEERGLFRLGPEPNYLKHPDKSIRYIAANDISTTNIAGWMPTDQFLKTWQGKMTPHQQLLNNGFLERAFAKL